MIANFYYRIWKSQVIGERNNPNGVFVIQLAEQIHKQNFM